MWKLVNKVHDSESLEIDYNMCLSLAYKDSIINKQRKDELFSEKFCNIVIGTWKNMVIFMPHS